MHIYIYIDYNSSTHRYDILKVLFKIHDDAHLGGGGWSMALRVRLPAVQSSGVLGPGFSDFGVWGLLEEISLPF